MLTLQDVEDVVSKEIEVACNTSTGIKLTFTPFSSRYHIYENGVSIWGKGERDANYAVARYNDLNEV